MAEKILDIDDSLALRAEKQVSDRTNFIIAANTFLFSGFAGMLTSTMITGYLRIIPIIVAAAGIALNFLLRFANNNQVNKIRVSLSKKQGSLVRAYFNIGNPDELIFSSFNIYAPFVMIVAWGLSILVYILVIVKII